MYSGKAFMKVSVTWTYKLWNTLFLKFTPNKECINIIFPKNNQWLGLLIHSTMGISKTPSVSATTIEAEERASPTMTGTIGALLHSEPDTVSSCPVTRAKAALSVVPSARQVSATRYPKVTFGSRTGSRLISSTVKIIALSQRYERRSTLKENVKCSFVIWGITELGQFINNLYGGKINIILMWLF